MTTDGQDLGYWEDVLVSAGIGEFDAFMWLGALVSVKARFPDDPSVPYKVAGYAVACDHLQIGPSEGIEWYHADVDEYVLPGYKERGRVPRDWRTIAIEASRPFPPPAPGRINRNQWGNLRQELHDWMSTKISTSLILECIRAELRPGEAEEIVRNEKDPIFALRTLAALLSVPDF